MEKNIEPNCRTDKNLMETSYSEGQYLGVVPSYSEGQYLGVVF